MKKPLVIIFLMLIAAATWAVYHYSRSPLDVLVQQLEARHTLKSKRIKKTAPDKILVVMKATPKLWRHFKDAKFAARIKRVRGIYIQLLLSYPSLKLESMDLRLKLPEKEHQIQFSNAEALFQDLLGGGEKYLQGVNTFILSLPQSDFERKLPQNHVKRWISIALVLGLLALLSGFTKYYLQEKIQMSSWKKNSIGLCLDLSTWVAFMAVLCFLLKAFDNYLDVKIQPATEDELAEHTTMRSMDYKPFVVTEIQQFAEYEGKMNWANRDDIVHIKSGDHGFFIDFDLEYPPVKQKNEYRIILTGGSSAQGWGASSNDTMFYSVLEKKLNDQFEKKGKHIRVINLSMASSVSQQNAIALNLWGHKLDPDLIISFSGHNDIAVPVSTGSIGYLPPVSEAIIRYSESPAWWKHLAKFYPAIAKKTRLGSLIRTWDHSKYLERERMIAFLTEHDSTYHGSLSDTELQTRFQKAWANFHPYDGYIVEKYSHAIFSISRDFPNVPLFLVLQPLATDCDNNMKIYSEMAQIFSERQKTKIFFYDMQNYWRKNHYFPGSLVDSCHLSDMGHRLVADKLAELFTPMIENSQRK